MSKRNLVIEEGSVEALARLQKQDESSAEGCEQLLRRAASVARPPSSPSLHEPPCLKLYAAGFDPRL